MSTSNRLAIERSRTIALWCPDWPVLAAQRLESVPTEAPFALIEHGVVFACNATARAEGVRRGLRLREAQARATTLATLPYDPGLDSRSFEPIIARIEALVPGVQMIRPGTVAMRAKGPARYYDGEDTATRVLIECLAELEVPGARAGVAEGPFAAVQAARQTGQQQPVRIVEPGATPQFLAPLPVTALVPERMGVLLQRLGVRTVGDFAALAAVDVQRRFGGEGAHAHALAGGYDGRTVTPRTPPPDFDAVVVFEPALERVDQVTFGIRSAAERFIAKLTASRLVCTALRVDIQSELHGLSTRCWLHPRWFGASEVVDRVRWQLQGSSAIDAELRSGVVSVRLVPERVDSTHHHEQGLWGSAPEERIHHGLTRVQSMLGHEAVVTAVIGGGRMLAERQIFVPWGDRAPGDGAALQQKQAQPWPGSLPGLAPSSVFAGRLPVALLDEGGSEITVDDRGALSATPTWFVADHRRGQVRAWAGPWPVVERWWDPQQSRRATRFQLVDNEGTAWLLLLDQNGFTAEARYD